jgi:hypothetical protein
MTWRTSLAAGLLLVRGGVTTPAGVGFVAAAGVMSRDRPSGVLGNVVLDIFAGGMVILAIGFMTVGMSSIVFGFLILTRKRPALVAVVIGEGLMAIALAAATLAFARTGDADLTIVAALALGLVSVPVLILLALDLARRRAPVDQLVGPRGRI